MCKTPICMGEQTHCCTFDSSTPPFHCRQRAHALQPIPRCRHYTTDIFPCVSVYPADPYTRNIDRFRLLYVRYDICPIKRFVRPLFLTMVPSLPEVAQPSPFAPTFAGYIRRTGPRLPPRFSRAPGASRRHRRGQAKPGRRPPTAVFRTSAFVIRPALCSPAQPCRALSKTTGNEGPGMGRSEK